VECDGNFFRNRSVAVVGNESAACSGALTMLVLEQRKSTWFMKDSR